MYENNRHNKQYVYRTTEETKHSELPVLIHERHKTRQDETKGDIHSSVLPLFFFVVACVCRIEQSGVRKRGNHQKVDQKEHTRLLWD